MDLFGSAFLGQGAVGQCLSDSRKCFSDVCLDQFSADSAEAQPQAFPQFLPLTVGLLLIVMNRPIYLNDEAVGSSKVIDDEGSEWLFATEFHTLDTTSTEMLPEQPLAPGWLLAELPGNFDHHPP
jgi:hypothetical protein